MSDPDRVPATPPERPPSAQRGCLQVFLVAAGGIMLLPALFWLLSGARMKLSGQVPGSAFWAIFGQFLLFALIGMVLIAAAFRDPGAKPVKRAFRAPDRADSGLSNWQLGEAFAVVFRRILTILRRNA